MAAGDPYTVRLDDFEGPLDLLLHLIRKDEVDLHDIPIASITDQYLEHVRRIETDGVGRIDIDTAGEFLVMAATLMEIKSRMLMPRQEAPAGESSRVHDETEDPRSELVRQLLEYKRYRDAANALERRAEDWRKRFPAQRAELDDQRLQAALEAAPDTELEDLDLLDLVEAFRRISETVIFDRLGDHQVTYDDTPIELHAEDIVSRLRAEATELAAAALPLQRMFEGRTRSEMVGLFLALLELVRNRRVRVAQDRVEGLITVSLRDEPEGQGPGEPESSTVATTPTGPATPQA